MTARFPGRCVETRSLTSAGLTPELILDSIQYTHRILDQIDEKLIEVDAGRMADMVERANLSAIVGNLFGAGFAKHSAGQFIRNGPHKYPDLLSQDPLLDNIEIKVALGKNKPKGHLAKEGLHIVCRYVLVHGDGKYDPLQTGNRVAIWEVRFGNLLSSHFNISNTAGDSGKTAVVNADGMNALKPVFVNIEACPYTQSSSTYRMYRDMVSSS